MAEKIHLNINTFRYMVEGIRARVFAAEIVDKFSSPLGLTEEEPLDDHVIERLKNIIEEMYQLKLEGKEKSTEINLLWKEACELMKEI